MTPQLQAFLDTIAYSEIGPALLALSDNGYNVIVGSTPEEPNLFDDYSDHPRMLIPLSATLSSTAAGRYQILERYFDVYKTQLGLADFGPDSQDKIAIKMIGECDALSDISNGKIEDAIYACRSRWASFPSAGYGQHQNKMVELLAAFRAAGGIIV